MSRRKRYLDDGDDSDSNGNSDSHLAAEDPDAREERELFENPYRKRRRTNGKEAAIYGVFGDDSEDEVYSNRGNRSKPSDWTKAPDFVSSNKPVKLDDSMQVVSDSMEEEVSTSPSDNQDEETDESEGENDTPDKSEPSRAPSPRLRIEEEDELETRPQLGGIGSKASMRKTGSIPSFTAPSRGGIGSKPSNVTEDSGSSRTSPFPEAVPQAFGRRSQSSMRDAKPTAKPVSLPASEMAHFHKLQGTFGAKMLAKMGWKAGTGLGVEGEGIVTPIETKLRPQKMGIAFKGFKEKTEQAKMEARRRGEILSDDEDESTKKMRKKMKEAEQKRSDVWKRPKKIKTKIEHKTYEQILAEAGEEAPAIGIGQIIDARGPVLQEVASLAEVSLNSWTPTNDPTRIPEVRHNIRIIADACKSDLGALAREANALQERKRFVTSEDARLRKQVEDEAELISRLQQIQIIAGDIDATAKNLSSQYEVSLEPLSSYFQRLINEYAAEYEKYNLDEIVVAAIAPIVRRMVVTWNPLEDPAFFLATFRNWRRALKTNEIERNPGTQKVNNFESETTIKGGIPEKPMTPFESLLWNIWLPKVRTAINNDWMSEEPQPAVKLFETWSPYLPAFIRDNLLDQLILPKVHKAVRDWNIKRSKVSLQTIVFPWLPYVDQRLEDVVGDAKRKITGVLRAWTINESIPDDLDAWREVFNSTDWDATLLKYVVPKLGASLRNDFRINPRDQKMEPLNRVLLWSPLLRSSIFSQILETEFFVKWLDVLHLWLIQPRVSFEEVAQWYSFWKGTLPEDVRDMPGVNRGFTRGLQLMNEAIQLGPDAPNKLIKPDFVAEIAAATKVAKDTAKTTRPAARTFEITFRSIVEEFAASHNLLFIPTGKAHERSRMPLFRVSRTANGKKGLLVYMLDDAVWAPRVDGSSATSDEFMAISLEDMVSRVS